MTKGNEEYVLGMINPRRQAQNKHRLFDSGGPSTQRSQAERYSEGVATSVIHGRHTTGSSMKGVHDQEEYSAPRSRAVRKSKSMNWRSFYFADGGCISSKERVDLAGEKDIEKKTKRNGWQRTFGLDYVCMFENNKFLRESESARVMKE